VATTFDPDDFELRWPPQLLVDEAKRLLDRKRGAYGDIFSGPGWLPDVEWLLTEAFVSTEPAEVFKPAEDSVGEAPAAETRAMAPSVDRRGGQLARAWHSEAVLVRSHRWPHQFRLDGASRG